MNYEDLLYALKNGNIPRESILDFSVGRENELNEFKNILSRVEKGSSITKFINGGFGSGKSFFLKIIEETAFQDNFVVSRLTLSQNLQFHQINNIYKEIANTLRCKTGDSLNHIIDRWIIKLKAESKEEFEEYDEIDKRNEFFKKRVNEDLTATRICSNSFATTIENYIRAKEEKDDETANNAQAWLRGESHIPARIKNKFGVKGEIEKKDAIHFLEALSTFIYSIGYPGIVILIDEAEYTVKTIRKDSRSDAYNYMREIDDKCSNGNFSHMLFVFAGTPQFYEDELKGVKSYDALYSRIVDVNESEYIDYRNPIINLEGFKQEDIKRISEYVIDMHKQTYEWDTSNVEESIDEFIEMHIKNSGLTGGVIVPRDFIRNLISVLDTVEQHQEELNNKNKIIKIFKEKEESPIEDEEEMFDDW